MSNFFFEIFQNGDILKKTLKFRSFYNEILNDHYNSFAAGRILMP